MTKGYLDYLIAPASFHAALKRLAVLACLLLLVIPATAQVTGVSYTVSPIGTRVFWDDDAGLSNGNLYGGELGLGFGEYLEVGAIYLTGGSVETDFSGFSGGNQAVRDALTNLAARDVKIQRYGGKLRVNLGAGRIVPFITAGTGIVRFDPDGLDESENIYVNGGLGATFSLADRYTLSVAAENLAYRFNAGAALFSDPDLNQVGLTRASFNQQTVYNPALSASLKFYLGGRGAGEMTDVDRALLRQFRGGGFRLAVEPFYGQIDFNDELGGFPTTQALAGVNAGFDLGPYIGVRGFYWRATEQEKVFDDGFTTDLTELAFYGGELDLRLGNQLGLSPYLILGGGYMDVGDAYEDFSGFRPESRYFAIGGGGIELSLSRSIKLQGGLRGLLMSNEMVGDVSAPSSVYGNLMYTAGINFNIGGSGRTTGQVLAGEREVARAEGREREAMLEEELLALRARIDSLETARVTTTMPPTRTMTFTDSTGVTHTVMVVDSLALTERDTMMVRERSLREQQVSNLTGETLTIPIPKEGAIYIRFGNPEGTTETFLVPFQGGLLPQANMNMPVVGDSLALGDSLTTSNLSPEQIRRLVAQALTEQQAEGLTTAELNASLQALERRLDERIARETRQLRTDLQGRTMQEELQESQETTPRPSTSLTETFSRRELVGALPFIGVREGSGPDQFLVGVRGDFRFPERSQRLVPEVGLGFSDDGVAFSAISNLVYPLVTIKDVQPYLGGGIGLVSNSGISGLDLVLNLLAGAEYTLPNGMTFFGEYSTLDFFDRHRVILGYRLRL